MIKLIIKVGSRDSKLAIAQSNIALAEIKKNYSTEFELISMKTTGDMILNKTLDKIGGKGLFIKELNDALFNSKVDICVHSLKDVPMDIDENFPILAYLKRENPLDVLILPKGIKQIDSKLPIGTSSKRRAYQLKNIYPKCYIKPIRGNLITRLKKLDDGEYSALVLAYAGIKRLNLEDRISRVFTEDEILPACCQGIIAIQGLSGKDYPFLKNISHKETEYIAKCERSFVREFDGGCSKPISAYATINGNKIMLKGYYSTDDNSIQIKQTITDDISKYEQIGVLLAKKIKEILNEKR